MGTQKVAKITKVGQIWLRKYIVQPQVHSLETRSRVVGNPPVHIISHFNLIKFTC